MLKHVQAMLVVCEALACEEQDCCCNLALLPQVSPEIVFVEGEGGGSSVANLEFCDLCSSSFPQSCK